MSGVASLFVALAEVELHLPGARSLKDKRASIRSLLDRLRHRLAVLVIECDHQALHQRAGIAVTALATDADAARRTVQAAVDHIHQTFDGVVLEERVSLAQVR